MYKKLTIVFLLTASIGVALAEDPHDQFKGQVQMVEKRIDGLEKGVKQAQDSTSNLIKQVGELAATDKAQQQKLNEFNNNLKALAERQTTLGKSLDQLSRDTEQKTQTIDETIMSRSKWYGAAIAALLLLLGGCYWYLRRRNDASEQSLTAQVKSAMETVRSTEEKIAKSDTALADSLFEILNKLKEYLPQLKHGKMGLLRLQLLGRQIHS